MPSIRKHITYIVHGARADLPELRQMVSWVRDRGHAADVRITWNAGDAEALTAEDADHAMDVILRRKPVRIDTASMNGRRFLNVSTGGMGAEATAETPADFKASLGTLAYAITAIRKLASDQSRHARFSSADFELDVDFLVFAVGSARVTGGGTMMTPDASVTDGLLDLCVIEAMSRRDFAVLSLQVKKGEHVGLPGVHYVQLPWVKVAGTEPLSVNLDGEGVEATVCDYRARRADLLVHVQHLPGEAAGGNVRG